MKSLFTLIFLISQSVMALDSAPKVISFASDFGQQLEVTLPKMQINAQWDCVSRAPHLDFRCVPIGTVEADDTVTVSNATFSFSPNLAGRSFFKTDISGQKVEWEQLNSGNGVEVHLIELNPKTAYTKEVNLRITSNGSVLINTKFDSYYGRVTEVY